MAENRPRQFSLDLLRLLATVLVMWVHCGQMAGLSRAVTEFGSFGVQLFFILSGYLAAASLGRDDRPLPYYKRRALRILPVYWLVVAVHWVLDLFRYGRQMPLAAALSAAGPCGAQYLRYVFLLQMVLPSDSWDLWNNRGSLWTMSAFAVFYLLAPWLWRALRGFWPTLAAAALLLAVKGRVGAMLETALTPLFAPEGCITWYCARTPLLVLHCFLLGMAVWQAVRERRQWWLAAFCAAVLVVFRGQRGGAECLFTLLVLAAVSLPQPALPQSMRRALRYLSEAGFCVYLVHPLLLEFVPRPVLAGAAAWGYAAAILLLVGAASCAVYTLAVRPFEAWITRRIAK